MSGRSIRERFVASVSTGIVAMRRWARAHPVLAALYSIGLIGWVAFNVLVGMPVPVVVLLPLVVGLFAGGLGRWWRRRPGRTAPTSPVRYGLTSIVQVVVATAVTMLVIQAVPYGRDQSNPPVLGEPAWATPETRELMVRACYACHSNEVEYPSYASFAPISWAVQSHIDSGRSEVNYSEFVGNPGAADETIEVILDGSMPPAYFTQFGRNPEARLTDDELAALLEGLRATPGMGRDEP